MNSAVACLQVETNRLSSSILRGRVPSFCSVLMPVRFCRESEHVMRRPVLSAVAALQLHTSCITTKARLTARAGRKAKQCHEKNLAPCSCSREVRARYSAAAEFRGSHLNTSCGSAGKKLAWRRDVD